MLPVRYCFCLDIISFNSHKNLKRYNTIVSAVLTGEETHAREFKNTPETTRVVLPSATVTQKEFLMHVDCGSAKVQMGLAPGCNL